MGQHSHTTRIRNGLEIEVMFEVESYGYPSNHWDDPGEGMELCIVGAFICGTFTEVDLTDAERATIEEELHDIDPNELVGDYD